MYSNRSGNFQVTGAREYPAPNLSISGVRPWIVSSRFNGELAGKLLAGCTAELAKMGIPEDGIRVTSVPGAYEIPPVADRILARGEADVLIALGVVVKGETDQHDYIGRQVSQSLAEISIQRARPVVYGVLVTHTLAQAEARIDRGPVYANIAIEMANKFKELSA